MTNAHKPFILTVYKFHWVNSACFVLEGKGGGRKCLCEIIYSKLKGTWSGLEWDSCKNRSATFDLKLLEIHQSPHKIMGEKADVSG